MKFDVEKLGSRALPRFILACGIAAAVCVGSLAYAAEVKGRKGVQRPAPVDRETDLSGPAIDLRQVDTAQLSEMVFHRTNLERERAGLPPFRFSDALGRSAYLHSCDMARRDYFDHKSKGLFKGTSPRQRATAQGFNTPMVAENIAMIPAYGTMITRTIYENGRYRQVREANYRSYQQLAEEAVVRWMQSPGHRRNILDGNLSQLGVGVALGYHDNIPYLYMTQNFGG